MPTPIDKVTAARDAAIIENPDLFGPGKLTICIIAHDDDCGIFNDQECDCDPHISFTPSEEFSE